MSSARQQLPSLTALATFEAAARLLSFKAAAAELNVTPAAVSRQIRNLEQDLGTRLFARLYRRVRLTPAGELLLDAVAGGFGGIAATARSIRGAPATQRLTIGSTNGMASFWLLPRLKGFWKRHPDISIDHVISDATIDMKTDQVDLCIRFGSGAWPGFECRYLFGDVIYPVCGPGFLEGRPAPAHPEDMLGQPLLDVQVAERWLDWAAWLRHHGVLARPAQTRHFNNYVVAVQAAVDNQGFALGWHAMVGGLIAGGRLVRPLAAAMPSPGAFFLVHPAGAALKPEALLFGEWLQQEIAERGAAGTEVDGALLSAVPLGG